MKKSFWLSFLFLLFDFDFEKKNAWENGENETFSWNF